MDLWHLASCCDNACRAIVLAKVIDAATLLLVDLTFASLIFTILDGLYSKDAGQIINVAGNHDDKLLWLS
jgi:hypothetical protein